MISIVMIYLGQQLIFMFQKWCLSNWTISDSVHRHSRYQRGSTISRFKQDYSYSSHETSSPYSRYESIEIRLRSLASLCSRFSSETLVSRLIIILKKTPLYCISVNLGGALKLEFNSNLTSNTNTITQLNEELQTIIDRAKPMTVPTPNYDIGPVLSSPTTIPVNNDEKPTSVKELSPIEQNFNLRPEESHIRPKTTREDFFRTKSTPVKDLSDPFNQLDPLWSLRS